MTLETVTAIFGWMTLINIGLYTFTAVFIMTARDRVAGLHARLMGVEAPAWPLLYAQYLSLYKVAIIVLNLVPYLALRIVG